MKGKKNKEYSKEGERESVSVFVRERERDRETSPQRVQYRVKSPHRVQL